MRSDRPCTIRRAALTWGAGAIACLLLLAGTRAGAASLTSAPFGTMADGMPVARYTMATAGGVSVTFMSYGGAITDVVTPNRQGRPGHIVLGFPTLRDYETKAAEGKLYLGAPLGRYANWIDRGRFRLVGREYQLSLSAPPHTIHGGKRGSTRGHGPCSRSRPPAKASARV